MTELTFEELLKEDQACKSLNKIEYINIKKIIFIYNEF